MSKSNNLQNKPLFIAVFAIFLLSVSFYFISSIQQDQGKCVFEERAPTRSQLRFPLGQVTDIYGNVTVAPLGSCNGFCGAKSQGNCYCDAACVSYGDCCNDYTNYCLNSTGACPSVYSPVCGSNGITYTNKCEANLANANIACEGKCPCTVPGKQTCENSCGTTSSTGSCYCDTACVKYGDCCPDYKEKCLQLNATCLYFSPPYCPNGKLVSGGIDVNGCPGPMKCIPLCANSGEEFSKVFTDKYPNKCCIGLTEWEAGMDTRKVINGICVETGLVSGWPVGICIKCGDNVCDKFENICNCPQDCNKMCSSDYIPVCGFINNQFLTYSNKCEAGKAGAKIVCESNCANTIGILAPSN